ncbi:hypothetical protein NBRC116494_00790 [Aurantivibrio plasticivorans]
MFISLRWKAVVFLSLALVSITVVLTWQTVNKQLDSFNSELDKSYINQHTLLLELINDAYLKLSQFSQLISTNQTVSSSLDSSAHPGHLQNSLDEAWLSYSINLGLDYLAIYNNQNRKLASVGSPKVSGDTQFSVEITKAIDTSTSTGSPQSFVYCQTSCILVVIEPFINSAGESGFVVIAQNMADLLRVFYSFSSTGLAILLSSEPGQQSTNASRHLTEWQADIWAISDFRNLFPVLMQYSKFNRLNENRLNTLFTYTDDQKYLIKLLPLDRVSFRGIHPMLIFLSDTTANYNLMVSNIERGVITGFFGLIAAEVLLLLLLNGPLRKIRIIAESLRLLPSQEFSAVLQKVKTKPSYISDELTTLEKSTIYVTEELKELHHQIDLKNESLNGKIDELTRSRSFLKRLFDSSQIFIITQGFDGTIHTSNARFEAVYGKSPDNFDSLFSIEGEEISFRQEALKLKNREIDLFQQETQFLSSDGKPLVINWTHALVESENGDTVILSIGMDHTLQKNAENDLRWMAHHDSLTNIGNRRWFTNVFTDMLASNTPGVLVFIDVNRFKQINDIYGHNFGDQVLINIANKLRKFTRSSDVVCRYAGDEFTLLLNEMTKEQLKSFLQKLCQELKGSIQTNDGRTVKFSASVGASIFPEHGEDAQTLIVHADMAMYHAKKKGRSQWHIFDINDAQVAQIRNENKVILSIKNALRNHSFSLVFQPILEIDSESISHHEVLIRMTDEFGENISPGMFIPLAEKSGEIRQIDNWVLENALKILSNLNSNQLYTRFAINISAPTLQHPDFPTQLCDQVEQNCVSPDQVVIELTETAYIENFGQVLTNLKHISNFGIKISLDDFGVGFSSFTYLKLMPLDYVKLDGSYIRSLLKNPDDQVFVRSMAAMITAFGMKTVAEFVEDKETLDLLTELGVSHGQGYFIGKPMPLDSLALESHSSGPQRLLGDR